MGCGIAYTGGAAGGLHGFSGGASQLGGAQLRGCAAQFGWIASQEVAVLFGVAAREALICPETANARNAKIESL
ncbi:hypothetical protein NA78x_003856 [Anatilimnocola sp. NA78]|uniref:hypothetical protein n=1 Tax=Anatilimnocola sp. NA78 TaxID=3415683 RepID=UPI003CE5517B